MLFEKQWLGFVVWGFFFAGFRGLTEEDSITIFHMV